MAELARNFLRMYTSKDTGIYKNIQIATEPLKYDRLDTEYDIDTVQFAKEDKFMTQEDDKEKKAHSLKYS